MSRQTQKDHTRMLVVLALAAGLGIVGGEIANTFAQSSDHGTAYVIGGLVGFVAGFVTAYVFLKWLARERR